MSRATSISLFVTPGERVPARKTIVCFGTPRGGTSMVAGAVHGLGVFMGDGLKNNVEDPLFNFDHSDLALPEFTESMKASVALRNKANRVWGWKYPRASIYLEHLLPLLVNPRFVIVFRDPIPAAIRIAGKQTEKKLALTVKKAMLTRLRTEIANLALATKHEIPTMLVSYEKAVQEPLAFLAELSAFTGQPLPDNLEPLLGFMEPGTYKDPATASGE